MTDNSGGLRTYIYGNQCGFMSRHVLSCHVMSYHRRGNLGRSVGDGEGGFRFLWGYSGKGKASVCSLFVSLFPNPFLFFFLCFFYSPAPFAGILGLYGVCLLSISPPLLFCFTIATYINLLAYFTSAWRWSFVLFFAFLSLPSEF